MNQDKLKLIVKNLEILIDSLKSEINSDDNLKNQQIVPYFNSGGDYDEVFEE